ncbi:MAG: M28 family peptidase [Flavobacteriales bacterium]
MLRDFDRSAQQNAMGYQWLRWSTEHIGHRLTGSEQGRLAEDAADSLFRLAGLEHVTAHPFAAEAWSRGRIDLVVLGGDSLWHPGAVALANTPLEALVQAQLVDVGNGLADDFDRVGDALRGRAALVNLGLVNAQEGAHNLHRSEKAALAIAHGAAAIVFVNHVDGHVLLTGTASIDGKLIPVPAACIAIEDGRAIRERLAKGAELSVRLEMTNQSRRVEPRDIIAEIRGTKYPEEMILVGGHLDSWDLATGATDNGLGSFSILDLARAMQASPHKPERTVRFVLFMGEEQGLLGSRSLVASYRNSGELAHVRCMINLDMSGHPQGFGVVGPAGWPEVLARLCEGLRSVDSVAFKGKVSEEIGLHSDHQPFLLANVPVIYPICDLGKSVYNCYHSSCDDIHLVDPQAMVDNVRFVGMLIYGLAAESDLPRAFLSEELRKRLIDAHQEEPLRLGGDWPW